MSALNQWRQIFCLSGSARRIGSCLINWRCSTSERHRKPACGGVGAHVDDNGIGIISFMAYSASGPLLVVGMILNIACCGDGGRGGK